MGTTSNYRYRFNGVISTDKTVMQNLEDMTLACGTWLTYDIHTGKWSVVINKPETPKWTFSDNNILGPITVSATGLDELYNSVKVQFPHIDLNDNVDYIQDSIPDDQLNPNEITNTLELQFDNINDPVQAEVIGLLELKQNRVDKLIKFQSDYTAIGVRAGDVITVTNSLYGFSNKPFRVITVTEADDDSGSILIDITALEYSENVYDLSDIYRYERSNQNGLITPGAIAAPDQPQLTTFNRESNPRIVIESTVNSLDMNYPPLGVEFWYSTDNTAYYLIGSDRPANGTAYEHGEVAEYQWTNPTTNPDGNVWVKARAYNSVTSSEFSEPGSIQFDRVQVPDAITDETVVEDEFGNLLDLLPLAALLSLLNGLATGDDGPGTILGDGNVTGRVLAGDGIAVSYMGGNATVAQRRTISTTQPSGGTYQFGDIWYKIG